MSHFAFLGLCNKGLETLRFDKQGLRSRKAAKQVQLQKATPIGSL